MTGIFGGSFDPIHQGHIHAAKQLLEIIPLDTLVFVPASQNPHKVTGPIASGDHRKRMLELALKEANDPRLSVSDIELKRGGPSYTVLTLEELKKQQPKEPLALILGNEVFQHFTHWYRPQRILDLANLVIVERERIPGKPLPSSANWVRAVSIDASPFSSTEIRKQLATYWKQPEKAVVPHGIQRSVWLYIKENRLYSVS